MFGILGLGFRSEKGRLTAALFAFVRDAYWQMWRSPSSPVNQVPGWQTNQLRA